MQLKTVFSRWTQVAGVFLMGGALAWTIKLCIIVATDGRIINTGAAALLMKTGIVLLLVGSTGIGHRLSRNRAVWLRAVSVILSPFVVFGLLFLLGSFLVPLFQYVDLWYAQEEAPIAIAVVVCLPIGYFLSRSNKSVTLMYRHRA